MPHTDPVGEYADALEFLCERLNHGNDCLMIGNARGAIVYYDSALASFQATANIVALRETYRALWTNKALAHQQLREFVKSQEAAVMASGLAAWAVRRPGSRSAWRARIANRPHRVGPARGLAPRNGDGAGHERVDTAAPERARHRDGAGTTRRCRAEPAGQRAGLGARDLGGCSHGLRDAPTAG